MAKHRRITQRLAAVMAAAMALAVAGAPTVATSTPDAGSAVPATHPSPATIQRKSLPYPEANPLVGSAHWLVYSYDTATSYAVKVRTSSGHTRTLRTESVMNNNGPRADYYSLVGDMLTADIGPTPRGHRDRLLWWNLKTKHHGQLLSPKNEYSYAGAVPGGILLDTPASKLEKLTTGGKVEPITSGVAFGASSTTKGLLISRGYPRPRLSFQSWTTPRKFVPVRHFTAPYLCGGPIAGQIGCERTATGDLGAAISTIAIFSMSGGALHTTSRCANGAKPGSNGFGNPSVPPYTSFDPVLIPHYFIFRACGAFQILSDTGQMSAFHTALNGPGENPTSAYGAFVYTHDHGKAIYEFQPGQDKRKTLVTARR
jgi:hypothetical protein